MKSIKDVILSIDGEKLIKPEQNKLFLATMLKRTKDYRLNINLFYPIITGISRVIFLRKDNSRTEASIYLNVASDPFSTLAHLKAEVIEYITQAIKEDESLKDFIPHAILFYNNSGLNLNGGLLNIDKMDSIKIEDINFEDSIQLIVYEEGSSIRNEAFIVNKNDFATTKTPGSGT